jgi:hypothetical protein
MKIKTATAFISAVLSFTCLSHAKDGVSPQDYLALTKENLPHVQVVIQAALNASNIEDTSLSEMKKQARLSALLPRLRLRMDYDPNAIDLYEYEANARQYDNGNTHDRWERLGNTDDRLGYGGFVEWDLSALIWEEDDHLLAYQYAAQGGLKRRRIVEVTQRYMALEQLLPNDSSGSIEMSDIEAVLDNAIYLDQVTDYLLSDILIRLKAKGAALEN